jgi:hypothetical protein
LGTRGKAGIQIFFIIEVTPCFSMGDFGIPQLKAVLTASQELTDCRIIYNMINVYKKTASS